MLLGSALMLTIVASAWLYTEDDDEGDTADVVEVVKKPHPVVKRNAQLHRAVPALALPVLAEARGAVSTGIDANETGPKPPQSTDIFKSHAWYVPPPPPPPKPEQTQAAPPAPPPLPFGYLGRVEEDGHAIVFLTREQRLYTLRKGEVADGQYRLESESKGRVEFVYLPLNVKQTLVIKGAL